MNRALIPLHAIHSNEIPLICIPGAGASVTTFIDFIAALGQRWPVYGLQPRGIDPIEPPHESVEAAALYNLRAITLWNTIGPMHLMGHSHGGLVAFDMALRLHKLRRPPASLTLIDTEPPSTHSETAEDVGIAEILREFIEALEDTFAKHLIIKNAVIESGQVWLFVDELRAALIGAKCLPQTCSTDLLRGSLAAFIAARRCRYIPSMPYPHEVHLAIVGAKRMSYYDDIKRQQMYAARWRTQVAKLEVWYGPGDHFSILQATHVQSLVKWWLNARKG